MMCAPWTYARGILLNALRLGRLPTLSQSNWPFRAGHPQERNGRGIRELACQTRLLSFLARRRAFRPDARVSHSWLIMYLTSSEISHAAFYLGNREIAHATLSGVRVEPIESLLDPNSRILPGILPIPDDTEPKSSGPYNSTLASRTGGSPRYSRLFASSLVETGPIFDGRSLQIFACFYLFSICPSWLRFIAQLSRGLRQHISLQ